MTRPHPLTAMSEWQWDLAWQDQHQLLKSLPGGRGTWLPNVVEPRPWGVLRWTSGRPDYAASTGQAVAETFAVLRPDVTDPRIRDSVVDALTDRPAQTRIAGVTLREHQVGAATLGAVGGLVLAAVVAALAGAGWVLVLVAAAFGAVLGGVAGGALADRQWARRRAAVLAESPYVRVVTGRYASPDWARLVEASTLLEEMAVGHDAEAEGQTQEAVQGALWEAAGLLLRSSDHTGVEVLADGVQRLLNARRP
ncbi:MAG TPA: hypothetical protein VIQ02_03155 [Jiangellaceae bacterium]